MSILITGSTGFIGKALLERLLDLGESVAIIVRDKHKRKTHTNLTIIDINNDSFELELIKFNPQIVFHLAGCSTYAANKVDKLNLWDSNFLYGTKLLDVFSKLSIKTFVNFNTSLAYNGLDILPTNYYALTKSSFYDVLKYYARISTFSVYNLILYNVYGPQDKNKRVLNYILDSFKSENVIKLTPGNQVLDFIYIDDVIDLCIILIRKKPIQSFEDIHVGTGKGMTLREVVNLIENKIGIKGSVVFGGLSYRIDEKMYNVSPQKDHRLWKANTDFSKGIEYLF